MRNAIPGKSFVKLHVCRPDGEFHVREGTIIESVLLVCRFLKT